MLEYDRIDISKGIDINTTKTSKECEICHYWYFLDKGFKYEPYLCNSCHHLMQKRAGRYKSLNLFCYIYNCITI